MDCMKGKEWPGQLHIRFINLIDKIYYLSADAL
jgi:hypothetical protein